MWKQRQWTGSRVRSWTLKAHLQDHTSFSKAKPPKLPPKSITNWDQVFKYPCLSVTSHSNYHSACQYKQEARASSIESLSVTCSEWLTMTNECSAEALWSAASLKHSWISLLSAPHGTRNSHALPCFYVEHGAHHLPWVCFPKGVCNAQGWFYWFCFWAWLDL